MSAKSTKKILLAFSGGLDTSAIIPWLIENYRAEIICYFADLGTGAEHEPLYTWAKKLGASRLIFEDLKDTFVSEFAYPAIRAGANYQDDYLLGTPLSRPLIAERLIKHAGAIGADAIAHGCTGKGNDQIRFERSLACLAPDLKVIAPWRIWDFQGRADLHQYLESKGIHYAKNEAVYSEDANLLHRSCEGGILEQVEEDYVPAETMKWIDPFPKLIQHKTLVKITFDQGIPMAINDKDLAPGTLLSKLNQLAGLYGIGLVDLVEERIIGIKSRGLYETPGGTLLHFAIKQLKHLCWSRQLQSTARQLSLTYGELLYDGFWHTPAKEALEAYFMKACETLCGSIELELKVKSIRIVSRNSPHSLYNEKLVSFEADKEKINQLAEGYCELMKVSQKQIGTQKQTKNQGGFSNDSAGDSFQYKQVKKVV